MRLLFAAKQCLALRRILDLTYRAKHGVYAFGYNPAESEPVWMKSFGWNLEHCEYIVGGWPWQILGTFCTVARVWEAADILFFPPVNNARFRILPARQISRDFNTTTSIGEALGNVMHDGMQYDPIQGQAHELLKVGNSSICEGYLLPHL